MLVFPYRVLSQQNSNVVSYIAIMKLLKDNIIIATERIERIETLTVNMVPETHI